MITMTECADLVGLAPNELPLCAIPSIRHASLLRSYLFNLKRGEKTVCRLIIGDFWRLMELGAEERAADVLHVLRLFTYHLPPEQNARRERLADWRQLLVYYGNFGSGRFSSAPLVDPLQRGGSIDGQSFMTI